MKKTTMKRCKTKDRSRILELPSHLISDILSRLAIETIFSCKCVCSTFLNIIKNPYFVELHLIKALTTEDGLIIQGRTNISNFLLVYNNKRALGKPNSDNCDYRLCQTMDMPNRASLFYNSLVFIIGSCNGLLCLRYSRCLHGPSLSVHNIYYICNPILGEFLRLPRHCELRYFPEYVGFGFCSKTKIYKVIRFLTPSKLSIYTLGTYSWRRIGEVPSPRTPHCSDASLNGNLHWITNSTKMSNLICSFNLETEQFSYVSPPHVHLSENDLKFILHLKVGLLGGLFCFNYNFKGKFEAFVMKDYGPEGCWTKKFSIDLRSSFSLQDRCQHYNVLILLNNGELILHCDLYRLLCCDLGRRTARNMVAENNSTCFNVLCFVPSFISLKDLAGGLLQNLEVVRRKTRCNLLTETGFKFIH